MIEEYWPKEGALRLPKQKGSKINELLESSQSKKADNLAQSLFSDILYGEEKPYIAHIYDVVHVTVDLLNTIEYWQIMSYPLNVYRVVDGSVRINEKWAQDCISAAYLHDVFEDVPISPSLITKEFDSVTTKAMILLSNIYEEENVREYYNSMYSDVYDGTHAHESKKAAQVVKIADRYSNIMRLHEIPDADKQERLVKKYTDHHKLFWRMIGHSELNAYNEIMLNELEVLA